MEGVKQKGSQVKMAQNSSRDPRSCTTVSSKVSGKKKYFQLGLIYLANNTVKPKNK
jgi:hypothetical protein